MFPFEKLVVYNKAFLLQGRVMDFLKNNKSLPVYLRNQYGRASLSIMLNLAEGSGRSTNKDRKFFFVVARGSVFECAAILDLLLAQKEVNPIFHNEIKTSYEEISRMLFAMIKNLE
ncbi:MAG: four helix bundle protein [Bacteroidetes bacterium B1(2017)]|nr:MAG: four helix bundle protein [Bacteroidetes bacterium B1(2017)]